MFIYIYIYIYSEIGNLGTLNPEPKLQTAKPPNAGLEDHVGVHAAESEGGGGSLPRGALSASGPLAHKKIKF